MTTTYGSEPTTAAWAASPLGEPECQSVGAWDAGSEQAMPTTKPTSIARHAVVAAALACGIGLGAAFSLAVFDSAVDSTDTTRPVVMVPGVEAPAGGPTAPTQALPEQHPAPKPEYQPLPKPIVAASESAPVVEGSPTAAEPPQSEVSSPSADGPSQPTFLPPSPGDPSNPAVTVDIDVPQLPQPEPADPQKPDPTIELGPETDFPVLTPQVPPKITLLPPKSRWTVNLPGQEPPKLTRGMPPTNRTRLNSIAGNATAADE